MDDYLSSREPSNDSFVAEQFEHLCDAFELEFQKGNRPRLERFVEFGAPETRTQLFTELLAIEVAYRRKSGEAPTLEEYAIRFPNLQLGWEVILSDTPPRSTLPHDTSTETDARDAVNHCRATRAFDRRFEVIRPYARGGLGEVFVARDRQLRRTVALKRVQEQFLGDADAQRRFLREAEVTGRLEHPGIVPVYALGSDAEGRPYYVMRFIDGETFKEVIDRFHHGPNDDEPRTVKLRKLLRHFLDVCNAMDFAHSRGVLHRDLKPANIMVGRHGETLVVDWGLAKAAAPSTEATESATDIKDADVINDRTQCGVTLGTPQFMSPEQAAGESTAISEATDVYGLGAVLYCMLTGKPPVAGASSEEVLENVRRGAVRSPCAVRSDVPRPLASICLKALARNPAHRYLHIRNLAYDIERWLAGERVEAHRESLPERAARWSRRHRSAVVTAAALTVTTIVALVVGIIVVGAEQRATEQQRAAAVDARNNEAAQRLIAETMKRDATVAKEVAVWRAYAARLQAADVSWEAGQPLAAWSNLLATQTDVRGWEFDFLYNKFNCGHTTLQGHNSEVWGIAFSRDGTRFVTCGLGVKVWDAVTGTILFGFHDGDIVKVVRWEPEGKTIATGEHNEIKFWDASTGRFSSSVELGRWRSNPNVSCIEYSPNGKLLAAINDHKVTLCDQATHRLTVIRTTYRETKETFAGVVHHSRDVPHDVAFSPDATRIVIGGSDGLLRLFDPSTREMIWSVRHGSHIWTVAFSPDGKLIVGGCSDGTLAVWDATDGTMLHSLFGHTNQILAVSFNRDGSRVATAGSDVRVWDPRKGNELAALRGHVSIVNDVAFSPGDGRIASASNDRTVRLWNLSSRSNPLVIDAARTVETEQNVAGLRCPGVSTVDVSSDGKLIVSAGTHAVRLWDAANGESLRTLSPPKIMATCAAFNADGKRVVATLNDRTVRIWSVADGRENRTLRNFPDNLCCAAFSPDGKQVVVGHGGTVDVWDVESGTRVQGFAAHKRYVWSAGYSPDGKRLVTAGEDGYKVWEVGSRRGPIMSLGGKNHYLQKVVFTADGKRIIGGSWQSGVIWDANNGRTISLLEADPKLRGVRGIVLSPDGKRIVGGRRADVVIFDAATGLELHRLRGHTGQVWSVAFTPDGKKLISGAEDGTIRIWDTSSGLTSGTIVREPPIPPLELKPRVPADLSMVKIDDPPHLAQPAATSASTPRVR